MRSTPPGDYEAISVQLQRTDVVNNSCNLRGLLGLCDAPLENHNVGIDTFVLTAKCKCNTSKVKQIAVNGGFCSAEMTRQWPKFFYENRTIARPFLNKHLLTVVWEFKIPAGSRGHSHVHNLATLNRTDGRTDRPTEEQKADTGVYRSIAQQKIGNAKFALEPKLHYVKSAAVSLMFIIRRRKKLALIERYGPSLYSFIAVCSRKNEQEQERLTSKEAARIA